MRVLMLSNFFPPDTMGGYELAMADVADHLVALGHDVEVLTRRPDTPISADRPGVRRDLLVRRRRAGSRLARSVANTTERLRNLVTLHHHIRRFAPDIILVGNASGLGTAMLDAIHDTGLQVVHDISDEHLLGPRILGPSGRDRVGARAQTRPARRATQHPDTHSPISTGSGLRAAMATGRALVRAVTTYSRREQANVDLSASYFRSVFLRNLFAERDAASASAPVFHHGVALSAFPFTRDRDPTHIAYCGRIHPTKGTDVLVAAVGELARRLGRPVKLTLAITHSEPAFRAEVDAAIAALPANCAVRIHERVPRDELGALLAPVGMFVQPAIWDEPYSIAVVEALVSGMIVVATATGGTPEAIEHGCNGLLVTPGDSKALADTLERVATDESLRESLLARCVEERSGHDLRVSCAAIEAHLRCCLGPTDASGDHGPP